MNRRKFAKRVLLSTMVCLMLISLFAVIAYAEGSGDVAGAIQNTWDSAKTQIKSVVNNVIFPVIDLVLAVLFFIKIATAYMDCAPVKAL